MAIYSTTKILGKLAGLSNSQRPETPDIELDKNLAEPQLTPSLDMQRILANSLTPSDTNDATPMS